MSRSSSASTVSTLARAEPDTLPSSPDAIRVAWPRSTKPHAALADKPLPDLLALGDHLRVDRDVLAQALAFAFAMGGSEDVFDRAIAEAALPSSSFVRERFSRDLFLKDLIEHAMPVRAEGRTYEPNVAHLLRVIGEPPRDPEVAARRRAVLGELAQEKAHRKDIERIFVALHRLFAELTATAITSPLLRRVEILRAAHAAFRAVATSFEGAESALADVRAFGEAVIASPAFARLDALLDHEQNLGAMDLRVRVGRDGEITTFQIVSVRERRENPFYRSPLGRLVERLALFFRGYRAGPSEVAARLLEEVLSAIEDDVITLFQLLGDIEVLLAVMGLRDRAEGAGLSVSFAELGESGSPIEVEGLFNPLLLGASIKPIPCDLTICDRSVVLVTGPNSGGKTRLLQALGITQLLAEGGFFVPCARAKLPRASGLFVSLVEEARADQREGQLGMELLRIRRMFEEIDEGALVLIDELCSGTNPKEGEEIAELVISLLPDLGVRAFVTTHLLSFAARLERDDKKTKGLGFLRVELDDQERPTFGFVDGVATTSLAHKIAARLGVTRSDLSGLIDKKRRAKRR